MEISTYTVLIVYLFVDFHSCHNEIFLAKMNKFGNVFSGLFECIMTTKRLTSALSIFILTNMNINIINSAGSAKYMYLLC